MQQNCKKFWHAIHKLDREVPGRSDDRGVPTEVVLANRSVSNEESVVLCRWAEVFTQLFKMENTEQMNFTGVIDTNNAGVLSQDLIWEEVLGATQKLKNGKAAGWDGLVAEVLKNRSCVTFLFHLFKHCLKFQVVPSMWQKGIIHPVLKHQAKIQDVLQIIAASLCFQCLTKPFVVF